MAQVKNEEKKNNIENLDSLASEFIKGVMIPRKAEFLKVRLLELLASKKASDAELTLLEKILVRERAKGQISDKNMQVLNRLESDRCTETCRCKIDNAPTVFHVKLGDVLKFYRQEPVGAELEKFIVYAKERIPPTHQMTLELVEKKELGHPIDPKDYPKEKILLHRLDLNKGWFDSIFDVEEDLLSVESTESETQYKF